MTRLGVFCTLGNHSKLVVTIILPKSPTLLDNFCKDVKIIHLSSEIILGQLLFHLAIFIWSHWRGTDLVAVVVVLFKKLKLLMGGGRGPV